MAYAATSSGIVDRMIRAAKLQVPLYEEVEADLTATNQALLVVVIGSVASGIGTALSASMAGQGGNAVGALIGGVIFALIGWAVWSYVVYFVGTRFVGGTATYGELLRTLGFSESPSVLLVLSFIPVLGGILSFVVGIWLLVAGFIATRQALDLDNTKTLISIVLGFLALVIVLAILGTLLGGVLGLGFLLGRAL
ncbi:MAG TPA: Yip1 family protein [Chloroflexota bacterium]|nr:Yip1 family protein [Chloroflexota bacterium]